jgi:hypothetical protein
LVVFIVSLAWVGGKSHQTALAQQNNQQRDNGRFQISAWTAQIGEVDFRSGCYMVDTATGELWEMVSEAGGCKWVKKVDRPH